ncbi:YwqG family protein [Streptomyces flaveolus]|uniref:hypothetical protein n=1 Tax=Streptomyces flaveolus TaxID=67297 RepID=UPI0036FB2F36
MTVPVSKFGGQPVWLQEPAWPVNAQTGEPLVFIGQFRVPGDEVRLAYLFLVEDDGVMGMDPTSGEADVLIQPDGPVCPRSRSSGLSGPGPVTVALGP